MSTIVSPNRELSVRVIYTAADFDDVGIKLSGAVGHSTPLTLNSAADVAGTKSELGTKTMAVSTFLDAPTCKHAEAMFAPRTPGPMTLSIAVSKDTTLPANCAKTKVVEKADGQGSLTSTETTSDCAQAKTATQATNYDVELFVPKIYSGALRVGIGGVFGATNHGYAVKKRSGSAVSEIVDLGAATVDPEVIVGYALFPRALTRSQGRDYVHLYTPSAFCERVGIYVGIGIVGAAGVGTNYKAEFFRSLHFGFEYEAAENLSIAFTGVYRRRDDLADGYHVGDPVDDGTNILTTKTKFGFGIIANFSIDFFKFTGTVAK
jgi:hypothetical protein